VRPMIEVAGARVFQGDCIEVLKGLPENSVDSVVTDPPYGLEFMGKDWDAPWKKSEVVTVTDKKTNGVFHDKGFKHGIRFSRGQQEMVAFQLWATEWAVECLRVLKPGGHILAFGGSRTWHRLAVAVEDAGFELRDSIAWIYGSGFPKSLDVSKAIDKRQGLNTERRFQFTAWMKSTGITAREINDITGTKMGNHYTTHPTQPAIATADLFDKLRPYLPEVPEYIERLVAERTGIEWTAYKQREVIGQTRGVKSPGFAGERYSVDGGEVRDVAITLGHTSEAKQWEGWGTALKPAHEPVVVGRKPLVGTVAENVLAWGVGGLNIDGSRIAGGERPLILSKNENSNNAFGDGLNGSKHGGTFTQGRWPANVIFDEVTAGLLDEQSGVSTSGAAGKNASSGFPGGGYDGDYSVPYGDTGGASRFFYVAKASKRDRNEGLEELEAQRHADRVVDDGPGGENPRNRTNTAKQNFHPTVKPTALMRYLIKLVTPPGGTVLDPFTGSGSTGKAALLDGFQFVGIELTEEYLPIIEGRLKWANEKVDEDDTLF
jgi:DNA modification methylase